MAGIVVASLVLLIMQFVSGINTVTGSPLADCTNPNVPNFIDANTVMSGTLYADSNVTVRNGAELTLTAGTEFRFCGEYDLQIVDAKLHLVGTEAYPIVFDSENPNLNWGRIFFNGVGNDILTSTLQHVEINNGGGSDPSADIGAIHILDYSTSDFGSFPTIDRVTINDSGSYGLFIRNRSDDQTPPALSNLSINGSTNAPLLLYAASVGGLSDGNSFSSNGDQVIEVRVTTGVGGSIKISQTWRNQPLPFELVGTGAVNTLAIGDTSNLPVLTLEPGITMWVGEDIFIRVNHGGLIAEGTATEPITFTSVRGSGPLWQQIVFERNVVHGSRLAYVNIEHAGNSNQPSLEIRDGALSLDHVAVRFNANAPGIYSMVPMVTIKNSTIEFNKVGLHFEHGAGGLLRGNLIQANTDAGIMVTNNSKNTCIDALGNNWGHASGPADSSNALDSCNQAKTNAGAGDTVADDVLYDPWIDADGLDDRSSISPDPFWVVADGLDQAELTVTVRDASGNPVPNKAIELSSTLGDLQQPNAPTDANGVVTATISSSVPGDAYLTARNATDDQPFSALASIHFWAGEPDLGGLVDPGGVPYVSPQLSVEGMPFQPGFPIYFRFPMQNSNTVPVDVRVVYGVSNLNIGDIYTPVDEVTASLQPGESWDAQGVWLPTVTGHRCVQASIEVTFPDDSIIQTPAETIGVGPFVVNFNMPEDPCKELDVDKLIPNLGGMNAARKHFVKALVQAYLIKECLGQELVFGSSASLTTISAVNQSYQVVVTPPVFTPPPLLTGDGVSEDQANASTALGKVAADLTSLDIALVETSQRIQWAGQADDEKASALQLTAYHEFQRAKAQKLADLAAIIDDLLDVTEGIGEPDTIFLPEDIQSYLSSLKSSGYDPDVIAFQQQFGLSSEEIIALLEIEIERYEESDAFSTTSYYGFQHELRDAALQRSNELIAQYGSSQSFNQLFADDAPATHFLGATTSEFVVGNPTNVKATVELKLRPVDIPIGWTYNLDIPAPTLLAGETITVTLTLEPDNTMIEGSEVRLAVEGYIDGEFIAGILFTRRIPDLSAASELTIYMPLIAK